jgi:hypothetical protein
LAFPSVYLTSPLLGDHKEVVVSDFLFRTALDQCKEEFRRAIDPAIPVDEQAVDEFAELFIADFSELLSGPRGESIWRRDGLRVRRLGHYLGTLAEFYAVSPGQVQPIGRQQLMKALKVIQPECKLRVWPEGAQRQDYCTRVHIVLED